MKRFLLILLCLALGLSMVACGGNTDGGGDGTVPPVTPDDKRPVTEDSKVLVVYFSMPDSNDNSSVEIDGETLGNTQYMAYVIQENTGANIFRIVPTVPYPTDHDELVDLAQKEQSDNARPAFNGSIENFDSYDTVFVGYPNWWGDMPMILYTFFDAYDFSGKTIIPFNTHGGSGFSNTISTIRSLEPNAEVKNGKSISRNSIQDAEQEIIDWVRSLGFEKSETPVTPEPPVTPGQTETPEIPEQPTGNHVLIVYFTAEYGNTERIANYIHSKIGGDIVKIEAAQPYTSQDLNYSIPNNRPEVEKAENARPEIAQTTYDQIDISKYDTVFIGYPIWWWTAPMIIGTFLEHYDLSGIHVYPFTQSASMNKDHFDTSMEFVRSCAGDAIVHDGLFTKTNSVIDEYLDGIEFSAGFNLAKPTPGVAQTIELWEEGKIPSWRSVSNNDPADFRPTLEYRPVASGVPIKGAVVLCAGGAFAFRGNFSDTYPTADRLTRLGYQCFVVQYRLRPFTQEESALDLARAVRYVRYYADEYGIDEKDIAIVGYSAGGILCGEHALNWKGTVSPTLVDSSYIPDALDSVNADVSF